MKPANDGQRLLHDLLDRFERARAGGRRIMAKASLSFASATAHSAFNDLLKAARDAGAVELIFDRDAPHLIARVVLADAPRLYAHLGRRPAAVGLSEALAKLAALTPTTDIGRDLAAYVESRWQAGKTALTLGPDSVEEAVQLLGAADAAFTELPGGRIPLRTRSARLLGDSKALERSLSRLVAFLKHSGRVDPDLRRQDVLRVLGLEKFPQPLLLAGPFLIGGVPVGDWTYVGLPPEAADMLEIAGPVASILTIENLESFNRHVRECRQPSDAVVYTSGFPSTGALALLRRLIARSGLDRAWHWGDVDGGGIKIGHYLEGALPIPVTPHLMSAELARAHGRSAAPLKTLKAIPAASSFAPLAAFLSSADAHWLEQETLDPQPVASVSAR
jgi:hypothetical protein